MSGDVELSLEVKLSLFVSAQADKSAPLSRDGVIELVQEYLVQRGIDWQYLIDQVRVEQIVDRGDATPGSLVDEGVIAPDVLGGWSDAPSPRSR